MVKVVSQRLVLISRWRLQTTRERLWELLINPTDWPNWWPHLISVNRLCGGDGEGIGAQHAFRWRSGLGYELAVVMTTRCAQPFQELEAVASGDARGIGLWLIADDAPDAVRLTYRWDVELGRPWMSLLASPLRPVFAWRHFAVMNSGVRGMAGRLACRLSDVEEWSVIAPLAGSVAGR